MSKIEVNELAVRSGSNITVSSPIQGEGTAGTNLQQGLCKAFVVFGEDTVIDSGSFNIASLTDSNTGQTHENFTNNFASSESFTVAISSIPGVDVAERPRLSNVFSTHAITQNEEVDTSTDRDADQFHFSAHGDLA